MKASLLKSMALLMFFAVGGIVPQSIAQVPDLEALERQLEERKGEEVRQQARRAEEARRAEQARFRWNHFERVSDGVLDRQQNVVWAAADNGREINWWDAMSYCRSLGSGWSLPNVSRLQSLYEPDTPFRKSVSGGWNYAATNLIRFTAIGYWSSEAPNASDAYGVSLMHGEWHSEARSYIRYKRALCVRHP